ncbi:MAG: hypothetical protein ACOWWO_11315 [Peptococcaceae bacterium]
MRKPEDLHEIESLCRRVIGFLVMGKQICSFGTESGLWHFATAFLFAVFLPCFCLKGPVYN